MVKRTDSTNPQLISLVKALRKEKKPLWRRLADELSRPARKRRQVNLSRISRTLRKGEVGVVPGKVLGFGSVAEGVKIAAWQFSESAENKIRKAKGKPMSITDLLKNKPKKVRIVG